MTSPQAHDDDRRYMARAIELARRAMGRTHPNPLVGCVIVHEGRVIGQGYHARAGTDHAEVAALKDASSDVRGATLYVNHEPCCHHGRTPPCTDAILQAGIARVVVGTIDPDPRVSGSGLEILRRAGVEVTHGVMEEESRRLNDPFFTYITAGRPWVCAKWAMSLDGKIATATGDSRWITGDSARRRVHQLRDHHDAILVGKQTLLADDPRLTCRLDGGRDPARFVIDPRLEAPLTHRVFNHERSGAPTIVLAADGVDDQRRQAFADRGIDVDILPTDDRGWLRPRAILEAIHRRQRMSVLVEGGGQLLGSLFDNHLIDYVYAFIAPKLIGGDRAPTPLGAEGLCSMDAVAHLRHHEVEQFAPDLLIHGGVGPAPTFCIDAQHATALDSNTTT